MSYLVEIAERAEKVELSDHERERYARHLILPEIGVEGQKRLKAARVLVVGAGGLGSPVLTYLAAAGVGTLGVADFDTVDVSNLQRQILHGTTDAGKLKIASATATLREINPHVTVNAYRMKVQAENAAELVAEYDIVADGTDNFAARYALNEACVRLGKPFVYGGVFRFEGQMSVLWAAHGPCYRCLLPEAPEPNRGKVPGPPGPLPGVIGTLQAMETVKLIVGSGELAVGRLLLFDALKMKFRELKVRKDAACPVCAPA